MRGGGRPALKAFAVFVAALVVVTLGLFIVGFRPTRSLGGQEAVFGMFAGCGVSFVASLISALPVLRASLESNAAGAQTALLAMLIRLSTTLVGILTVLSVTTIEKRSFLLWVAISYLFLLVADAMYALMQSRVGR